MKTDVEELSPTRVKLTIEVPFEELKPSLDKTYKEVARQVQIRGFRPGKVPPRIIDQYVGRGPVLEQAVNDALPELYSKAVQENEVVVLGQPDVEITKLDDGSEVAFTAEVDVRPTIAVPDYDGMTVTVDGTQVTPDDVQEQLEALQERFAVLTGASRPAADGDYVSIDLAATVDGQDVEEIRSSGMSYQVGSGSLLDGLDEALVGLSAGDSTTFGTQLVGGDRAGEQADVTVTVHSVKVREVPDLDDEFAQTASEFDTIGELRVDIRTRLERSKRMQQVNDARDRAMDALLAKVDIPLPDGVVTSEVEQRKESLDQQLEAAGMTREQYFAMQEQTEDDFETDVEKSARDAVKGGFILDQLATSEELGIEQQELTDYVVQQAMRMGVAPDQLAQRLTDSGQLGTVISEVLRNKALNLVVEHIRVVDGDGNDVDVAAIQEEAQAAAGGQTVQATDEDEDEDDEAAAPVQAIRADVEDDEHEDDDAEPAAGPSDSKAGKGSTGAGASDAGNRGGTSDGGGAAS